MTLQFNKNLQNWLYAVNGTTTAYKPITIPDNVQITTALYLCYYMFSISKQPLC